MNGEKVFFLMLNSIYTVIVLSDKSSIVYVSDEKSWSEARRSCHEKLGGHLATINLKNSTHIARLKSCMPDGSAWFGNYSVVSNFISNEGCYNKSDLKGEEITLDKVSANACELRCETTYFAVGGLSCICLPEKPSVSTVNVTLCNMACDDRGMCGGDGKVNVYKTFLHNADGTDNDLFCRTYSCLNLTTTYYKATNCSEKYKFSCEGDGGVKQNIQRDWDSALEYCISNEKYISISSSCPVINKTIAYWSTYFRGEEFIFDTNNISGTPYRVILLHREGHSFKLIDPIDNRQDINIKRPFLCEIGYNVTWNESISCNEDKSAQSTTHCLGCKSTTNSDDDTADRHTPYTVNIEETTLLDPGVSRSNFTTKSSKLVLIFGIGGACTLFITTMICVCCLHRRFKTKDGAIKATKENSVQRLSNKDSGHRNETVHNSSYGNSNEIDNNITGNDVDVVFIEAQEGVYDHLREHDNRKIKQEDTYGHAHFHNDNVDLYDVTSFNRNQVHEDIDGAYSGFEKPEGIYD